MTLLFSSFFLHNNKQATSKLQSSWPTTSSLLFSSFFLHNSQQASFKACDQQALFSSFFLHNSQQGSNNQVTTKQSSWPSTRKASKLCSNWIQPSKGRALQTHKVSEKTAIYEKKITETINVKKKDCETNYSFKWKKTEKKKLKIEL